MFFYTHKEGWLLLLVFPLLLQYPSLSTQDWRQRGTGREIPVPSSELESGPVRCTYNLSVWGAPPPPPQKNHHCIRPNISVNSPDCTSLCFGEFPNFCSCFLGSWRLEVGGERWAKSVSCRERCLEYHTMYWKSIGGEWKSFLETGKNGYRILRFKK